MNIAGSYTNFSYHTHTYTHVHAYALIYAQIHTHIYITYDALLSINMRARTRFNRFHQLIQHVTRDMLIESQTITYNYIHHCLTYTNQ